MRWVGCTLVVAKSTALSAETLTFHQKNRTAFSARKITTVVFDKTGTLTVGRIEIYQNDF